MSNKGTEEQRKLRKEVFPTVLKLPEIAQNEVRVQEASSSLIVVYAVVTADV